MQTAFFKLELRQKVRSVAAKNLCSRKNSQAKGMNLKIGKMRWHQGTLYLKPAGKFQFSPLYEFPEIVGSAEIDYACGLLVINETLEQYTKQKQREIKLSVGIGTYLKLANRGWQLVQ